MTRTLVEYSFGSEADALVNIRKITAIQRTWPRVPQPARHQQQNIYSAPTVQVQDRFAHLVTWDSQLLRTWLHTCRHGGIGSNGIGNSDVQIGV